LDQALEKGLIPGQNTRRSAEALAGAIDEVILNLLDQPDPQEELPGAIKDITQFALRAVGFRG
jgi:hypothetical protein